MQDDAPPPQEAAHRAPEGVADIVRGRRGACAGGRAGGAGGAQPGGAGVLQEFENTKAALELNVFSKLRKDKLLKELEHVAAKSPVSACHMSMDMDACACILT